MLTKPLDQSRGGWAHFLGLGWTCEWRPEGCGWASHPVGLQAPLPHTRRPTVQEKLPQKPKMLLRPWKVRMGWNFGVLVLIRNKQIGLFNLSDFVFSEPSGLPRLPENPPRKTPAQRLVRRLKCKIVTSKTGMAIGYLFTGFCKKSQLTGEPCSSFFCLGWWQFALLLWWWMILGLRKILEGHTFCGGLLWGKYYLWHSV